MSKTIEEILAEETPEERAENARWWAEHNGKPCRYGKHDGECWVHGYQIRRPCGHVCFGVPCATCSRPLTGRQRTRKRWRRQGRR